MRRLIAFLVSLPARWARDRAWRRALKARGLCTTCGLRPAVAGCDDCVCCWEDRQL